MSRKVYLAGPDVFFANPNENARKLKELCGAYGFEGIFPLDADLTFDKESPQERGKKIFFANVSLINDCQAVLANMMPFRGPSADVGTAWEMGYAFARGKLVVGYTTDIRRYRERATPDEYYMENFELVDNLMLDCSTLRIFGTPHEAVKYLASFPSLL